jgi:AcrR family transcriptional regulator
VRTAGEVGYAGMTVSAVIAAAGVSRKTFYEFFADREDCFLAAFDHLLERALAGARAAYEAGGDRWPDRLRALLAASLDALAAHPHEARLGFVEVLAAGPRALRRRDDALRRFMAFVTPGADAVDDQVAEATLIPEAIVGAVYEIIYSRVLQGRTAELPALLPELMFCILAPLLGPTAAAEHAAQPPPRRRRARRARPSS